MTTADTTASSDAIRRDGTMPIAPRRRHTPASEPSIAFLIQKTTDEAHKLINKTLPMAGGLRDRQRLKLPLERESGTGSPRDAQPLQKMTAIFVKQPYQGLWPAPPPGPLRFRLRNVPDPSVAISAQNRHQVPAGASVLPLNDPPVPSTPVSGSLLPRLAQWQLQAAGPSLQRSEKVGGVQAG